VHIKISGKTESSANSVKICYLCKIILKSYILHSQLNETANKLQYHLLHDNSTVEATCLLILHYLISVCTK